MSRKGLTKRGGTVGKEGKMARVTGKRTTEGTFYLRCGPSEDRSKHPLQRDQLIFKCIKEGVLWSRKGLSLKVPGTQYKYNFSFRVNLDAGKSSSFGYILSQVSFGGKEVGTNSRRKRGLLGIVAVGEKCI